MQKPIQAFTLQSPYESNVTFCTIIVHFGIKRTKNLRILWRCVIVKAQAERISERSFLIKIPNFLRSVKDLESTSAVFIEDHSRSRFGDHFGLGIICGAVQVSDFAMAVCLALRQNIKVIPLVPEPAFNVNFGSPCFIQLYSS